MEIGIFGQISGAWNWTADIWSLWTRTYADICKRFELLDTFVCNYEV